MRKVFGPLLMIIVFAPVCAGADTKPAPLKSMDFAYGMSVTIKTGQAVHQFSLPIEVYRHLQRRDLGDLRVFNGQDETVPSLIRNGRPFTTRKPAPVRLPLLPLLHQNGSNLDGLSLTIRRNQGGSVIELNTDTVKQPASRQLAAYYVDASALKQPVQSLEFFWATGSGNFLSQLRIAGSDDLKSWRNLSDEAVIAAFTLKGKGLYRRKVELGRSQVKYLRVSWDKDQQPPGLTHVMVYPADKTVDRKPDWLTLPEATPGESNEFLFEQPGKMPIDRARVILPQVNTVASVRLYSRDDPKQKWILRGNDSLYRLNIDGVEVTQDQFKLNRHGTRDRYWRLVVRDAQSTLGTTAPGLALGWVPEKLVFLSRGAGPFRLAFGNPKVPRNDSSLNRLLEAKLPPGQVVTDRPDKLVPVQAVLGGLVVLAGPDVVTGRKTYPWRTWLLWGVLLVAVALMAWMAVHLSRQLRALEEENPGD